MNWKITNGLELFVLFFLFKSSFCEFSCANEANRQKIQDTVFNGYATDMADTLESGYYSSSSYDQSDYWLDCFCELLLSSSDSECAADDNSASCIGNANGLESLTDTTSTQSVLSTLDGYTSDTYGFTLGVVWYDSEYDLQEVGIAYDPVNGARPYGAFGDMSEVTWDGTTAAAQADTAYFQVCYYDDVSYIPGEVRLLKSPNQPVPGVTRYTVQTNGECVGYCYLSLITNSGQTPDEIGTKINAYGNFETNAPTKVPSDIPSNVPSDRPSKIPTNVPSKVPSDVPSKVPTDIPSNVPSGDPTLIPTAMPSSPTEAPIPVPSHNPTCAPTVFGDSTTCGDPHYLTFDGLKHHYQGRGFFICMTACYPDDYFPFKVTFKQVACNNDRACVRQVRITVQNDTNSNETYLFFPSATKVTRLSDGANAVGTYECASGRCGYTIANGKFTGWYTDFDGHETPVIVRYEGATVNIRTTSAVPSCGLCGTFNGDPSDDFHIWNETAQDYYILYSEYAAKLPVSDLVWANTIEFGNSWCDPQFDDACEREFEIADQPTEECLIAATELCELAWDEYCDYGCDPLQLNFDNFIDDCEFDACAASDNDLPNYSYRDAINNGFFDMALDQCAVLCDYVDKPFITTCHACASQCEQLTNQNGCANDDCYGTCTECNENNDGTIDNDCKCNELGCSVCRDGWFKIDYDFPCQSCSGLFGCKSCKDFIGCEECEDGYTMVTHDTCGEDSFFNNNNKQLHYCVPSDGSDCTFGDIEDDIEDSDDNEDSKCPNVVECDSDPCDCVFDEYCDHCNKRQGCVSCMDGYYKQSWNHMCASCSNNFGGHCLKCNDFQGCTKCDNELSAVYDEDCGTYICA